MCHELFLPYILRFLFLPKVPSQELEIEHHIQLKSSMLLFITSIIFSVFEFSPYELRAELLHSRRAKNDSKSLALVTQVERGAKKMAKVQRKVKD